jgi:hypothetical protein
MYLRKVGLQVEQGENCFFLVARVLVAARLQHSPPGLLHFLVHSFLFCPQSVVVLRTFSGWLAVQELRHFAMRLVFWVKDAGPAFCAAEESSKKAVRTLK